MQAAKVRVSSGDSKHAVNPYANDGRLWTAANNDNKVISPTQIYRQHRIEYRWNILKTLSMHGIIFNGDVSELKETIIVDLGYEMEVTGVAVRTTNVNSIKIKPGKAVNQLVKLNPLTNIDSSSQVIPYAREIFDKKKVNIVAFKPRDVVTTRYVTIKVKSKVNKTSLLKRL